VIIPHHRSQVINPLATAELTTQLSGPRNASTIIRPSGADIINPAALAHLGERQTEALTSSHCEIRWILCILEVLCSIHRSGIPSLTITILGGAIGSAFGCYDRKVQATGRFLVRSQAEEDEDFPFARTMHTYACVVGRLSF
jgi:hypothetical protein